MSVTSKKMWKLCLLAILCTMLWGSAIPTIKIGLAAFDILSEATADKVLFAGIRFLGAGLILIAAFAAVKKRLPVSKEMLKQSVTLGMIQTAGQYFFMYIGLPYTTGVNASIFNAVGTLLYIVLAWLLFRNQKPTKLKVLGCIIGFSGILINILASNTIGAFSIKGDGFILIANICVAVGFLYSKHSVRNSDPFVLTGVQMAIGGLFLLVCGLILGGKLPNVTLTGIGILIYLMIVSAVAFSVWTLLLKEYPPALVGVFNFLTPVFGTIFSYLLSLSGVLDEADSFTIYTVVAILCTAAGILLCSFEKNATKEKG